MANKFQIKRTSTSGVTPNTTNSANSAYIAPGELAVNMADRKLYTADTSSGLIELGSNLTNLSVTGIATINAISANGSVGASGQVLTSNGAGAYWSSVASSGGTVTSVGSGNGLTGGPVTTTGTLSVLANTGIVANATGVYVNSSYIATISSNNATYLNGQLASFYTNASNISTGTLAFARLPSLYIGTTTIQSTSAAQALSGITTLAAGNTTITGFANVSSTLAAGNTTITGFANVSSTLQVTGAGTFANTIGVTGAATFSNTVNVAANISGTSANVTITAGSFTTTFANNGVVTFPANIVFSNTAITANGSTGTSGQVLASNGSGVYWMDPNPGDITGVTAGDGLSGGGTSGSVTVSALANTGIIANASGLFVNSSYIATLSANNTTYVNGKTEGNLNVNNATTATTANNATYAFGKSEGGLNVNSASVATTANNATYLDGYNWASPPVIGNTAANSATFTSLTANSLTANGSAGSSGQVLSSNGSGIYWSTFTIANSSVKVYTYNPTGNTTVITGADANGQTLSYQSGLESVFLNGVKLVAGVDYTQSNSAAITLTANARSTDTVQITSFIGSQTLLVDGSNTVTTSTTANTVVDAFSMSAYTTAKYLLQITSGADRYASEVIVTHNTSNAYSTEYGIVYSNVALGTVSTRVNAGNIELLVAPTNASSVVKVKRIFIEA